MVQNDSKYLQGVLYRTTNVFVLFSVIRAPGDYGESGGSGAV